MRLPILAYSFFVIAFASCGPGEGRSEIRSGGSFIDRLVAAAASGSHVDFSEANGDDWDSVFVFNPYVSVDTIYAALGYRWDGAVHSNISHEDAFSLIVFTKGGKVASAYQKDRSHGDFAQLGPWVVYGRDSAVFAPTLASTGEEDWTLFYPVAVSSSANQEGLPGCGGCKPPRKWSDRK